MTVSSIDAMYAEMAAESRAETERQVTDAIQHLRRVAKRQERQIAVGDWLLATFPFLRRPAEWAVRQMERWSR